MMPEKQNVINKPYFLFICFVAAIGGFLFGFDTAVISGALPFVVNKLHLNNIMEGWFVSSALLGCVIGVTITGRLTDLYGRKKIMILSAILFSLSALGCMVSMDTFSLISARLVGGLGIGMASMICPLYISELSPPAFRGRMVALYQLAITIGIVTAYLSNAAVLSVSSNLNVADWIHWLFVEDKWRAMIGLGFLPSFIFFLCLFAIPESPRWLILKGREKTAIYYLKKIVDNHTAENEVADVRRNLIEEKAVGTTLFSPIYRLALIIGLLLPFFSQVSGINAIIYYGPSILDKAGFSINDAFGGQVIIGMVNVIFTFVAIITVDRWGRKPLLLLGITGAVSSLLMIGILFKVGMTEGPWILVFILIFIACFAFSFGPVCWIIIGEIFPNATRGKAMSLATLSLWIANLLVGQMTPLMLNSKVWGPAATFWTFAILCVPAFWMTWKLIPETKGKSLEEIEAFWKERYARTAV